jgi:hypothetical protein
LSLPVCVADTQAALRPGRAARPSGLWSLLIVRALTPILSLYSSAIRRAEVAHIQLDDVDTGHGFLIVREGKNRKDRAVPIGANVCTLQRTRSSSMMLAISSVQNGMV